MALAIQTKRVIRGVTAVAERPDGVRIKFQPFPTPVFDENGDLLGAVNMLVDMMSGDRPALQETKDQPCEACVLDKLWKRFRSQIFRI
jgi:hypothetical protein